MSSLRQLAQAVDDVGMDALVQTITSIALVVTIVVVARFAKLGLTNEPLWAALRGMGQIMLVGFLLASVLELAIAWAALILLLMCAIAAGISRARAKRQPGIYQAAFVAIVAGTTLAVGVMIAMGALNPTVRDLVPVGSIFIATCMRTASIAFERYTREATSGSADHACTTAVHASLIPAVDGMKSLGFVWIPGLMTGLILAGESPLRAAFLQFSVVAMAFVAAAVTSIIATQRVARRQQPNA